MAHEAILREPSLIVELGSGASTLILGQILANQGKGRLISLDHDAGWAEKTRRNLEFLGLNHVVQVVHAPLVSTQVEGSSYSWYSLESDALKQGKGIDILFVDGPPRTSNELACSPCHAARYPAFSMLKEKMSPNAVIFVDDAGRGEEHAMAEKLVLTDPEWQAQWFDTVDVSAIFSNDVKKLKI